MKNTDIIKKTADLSVFDLKISGRLRNLLARNGYFSLTKVVLEDQRKLLQMEHLGEKSKNELLELRQFIIETDRKKILEFCVSKSEQKKRNEVKESATETTVLEMAFGEKLHGFELCFINNKNQKCRNINVSEIPFSVRTRNVLKKQRIISLLDICLLPYQNLKNFPSLGSKSIDEVLQTIRERVVIDEKSQGNYLALFSNNIIDKINSYFRPLFEENIIKADSYVMELAKVAEEWSELGSEEMFEASRVNPINGEIKKRLLNIIRDKKHEGIERQVLLKIAANNNKLYYPILEQIIIDMDSDHQIRQFNGKIYQFFVFLEEWIDTLEDRDKIVIEGRCRGQTLEEIGNNLDLTRERIRQHLARIIGTKPFLYEDFFSEYIQNYSFTKFEFASLFDLSEKQINYLLISSVTGMGTLQEFINEQSIPGSIRDRVPITFRDKYVFINNKVIPIKRDSILIELLKEYYSKKSCLISEFYEFYMSFLQEWNLQNNENLLFPSLHAFEAKLSNAPFVIWKLGHMLRYYDLNSLNIYSFLREVNIEKYMNTEISTLKIFKDSPLVMDRYNIQDEYELHNIFRKYIVQIKKYKISCERTPLLMIGNGNRKDQVETLLLEMAPVTSIALAEEYEKRYGVQAKTVMANFFKCIDIYLDNGIFDLEDKKDSNESIMDLFFR